MCRVSSPVSIAKMWIVPLNPEARILQPDYFPLVGLEAGGNYSIANLDAGPEVKIADRTLVNEGLVVEMGDRRSASVVTYRRLGK